MTTRFDIERAVLAAADLKKLEVLVMFVLLAHADNESAVIPSKFSPSLTDIANESKCVATLSRRTYGPSKQKAE